MTVAQRFVPGEAPARRDDKPDLDSPARIEEMVDAFYQRVLDAMVAAGCRDGCSKLNEATVDGLPFGESLKINRALQAIFLDEEGRAHGASLSLPSEK